MLPSAQLREVTIRDYLVVLKRRGIVILACFLVIASWSAFKSFKKIRLYRTAAKILVEKFSPNVTYIQQVYSPVFGDRDYMQSQINILTSRTLARKAVDKLAAGGDNTFSNAPDPEGAFLGGVSVSIIQGTQIISVGYISADPVKAAKYANVLADTFIQYDIEKKKAFTKSASGWLDTQLTEIKEKLQKSELALNQYLQKNEIVSVPNIEQKSQAIIEGLKQQKVTIENEISELSKRYKPKHPKIMTLNSRLDAVNKSINDETQKFLVLNEKMIEYNLLKREVDSNQYLYNSLLVRTKETEVSKQLENTLLQIIDVANIPVAPFSPNRKRDVGVGILLGLAVGVAIAFVLEYMDSTVKTAEDVEMYVRLPFLGYIPSSKQEAKVGKDVDLASHKVPHSRIAEAYRSIRASIIFSSPEDRPLKTILITSASPQEGKSTVSINLATVFANSNEKVLLVEADMRKPRVSDSFGLPNKEGLSSFLTGVSTLETAMQATSVPNLSLMPSGPKPPNPAELLTSSKTRTLLEELRKRYDRIIIDSPPVITVTDTAILANIVDGVIDVVRANFLNIELILRGRQRLYEAKSKIIGVILNNVNVKKEDSYYYYHYYYADDKDKEKKA